MSLCVPYGQARRARIRNHAQGLVRLPNKQAKLSVQYYAESKTAGVEDSL